MRFGMVRVICLAGVLLTAVPGAVHAQSPLELETGLVSAMIGLALDADADPSLAIAGAAAYPLTGRLAVEGELGHVFDMAPGDADVDSSLTTVHASALYFLDTAYVLTPYVAGGIGLGKFSHDVRNPPASIGQTEVGVNLGGGVTYPVGSAFIRGDFRYFKHIDNVPSVWRFGIGVSVRVGR
jgi:opacity protein-like surface antigen